MENSPIFKLKYEDEPYAPGELIKTRPIMKSLNGMTFLDRYLHSLYPDAVSFFLSRNPLALYESFKRQRRVKSEEAFATLYNSVVREMQSRVRESESMLILRFEDLLEDPVPFIAKILDFAGLEAASMGKLKLNVKPHYVGFGKRSSGRSFAWVTPERFHDVIDPNINAYLLENLSEEETARVGAATKSAAESLGYDMSAFG